VRGIDGGKLVKGVKLFAVCDKHGSLLDLELQPANTDDRAGVLPMLPRLEHFWFTRMHSQSWRGSYGTRWG
jgi:hypothetical protein